MFGTVLNTPVETFVSEIMLAIDDFSSNNWLEWNNKRELKIEI